MNIYKFETKKLIKSTLIWGVSISAGLVFYMAFYPLVADDSGAFETVMNNFPDEFLAFFGMTPELPVFSLMGYFGLTMGMIHIPIAIQASNHGFHILSIEERELTADFLLSKPITRWTIFSQKCLAVFTSLLFVNILVWISALGIIFASKGDVNPDFTSIFVLLSATGVIQLVFFSIALLISVTLKKVTSVLSFSMALGFGLYILSSFGSILSSNIFKLLSPYAHFNPTYILINSHYDWGLAIISFIVIIITLPLSYFFYQKRNIASI